MRTRAKLEGRKPDKVMAIHRRTSDVLTRFLNRLARMEEEHTVLGKVEGSGASPEVLLAYRDRSNQIRDQVEALMLEVNALFTDVRIEFQSAEVHAKCRAFGEWYNQRALHEHGEEEHHHEESVPILEGHLLLRDILKAMQAEIEGGKNLSE